MLDDKVRRILRVMHLLKLFGEPPAVDPAVVDSPAHRELALQAAVKDVKKRRGLI